MVASRARKPVEFADMNVWNLVKGQLGSKSQMDQEKAFYRSIEAAIALLQRGDYGEARKVLLGTLEHRRMIQDPKVLEWILRWLSLTWEQTEEYQEWTDFFSEFIVRHPDHSIAHHLRAESHWYQGRLQDALHDYSRALELDPSDFSALLGRGQVFVEDGRFESAVKDLGASLGVFDSIPGADAIWKKQFEAYARNGLGAAYAGLEQFGLSSEQFKKSIELCPDNAWVYFNRAEVFRNRGERTNAIEDYLLALSKKDPKLTASKRLHAKRMLEQLAK